MKNTTKKNHLKHENSPYLKQHIYNPVDWYPWSKEAFDKAKRENKPIFLSIGYSTCHWCHIMAHESFEDDSVAHLLNETFVCIKVDREERPDIDKIYMNVCQMITGNGGWPLTIMMTPEQKPFFAATYIPKESRYNLKGLKTLIPEIKKLWETSHDDLVQSSIKITEILQNTKIKNVEKNLSDQTLDAAYKQLFSTFDELYGGFDVKPKFPISHNILFLLRYWKKTNDSYCLNMVETTLEAMRLGGLYDHLGFGFHRYATDRQWIVPHFEKMLYDQALMIIAYSEAYQATKNPLFKQTVQEIITYVLRDMTSKEGGFYSAEDADSEGKEGKFYTWNFDELTNELSSEEIELISKIFNVSEKGNFSPETGIKNKENILYQKENLEELNKILHLNNENLVDTFESLRIKLFKMRETRIRPGKDDKIICSWNGLMIAALAKASQVFDNKTYIEKAEKAINFINKQFIQKNGDLLHIYQNGEVKITAYADDYAFLIWGLIELYQATFNLTYLQQSLQLTQNLLDHFWDKKLGGFYFTSDLNEKLIMRSKEIYDGAIPSANSVMMLNLIRLAKITGNHEFEEKANQIGHFFYNKITIMPSGYTHFLLGLDYALGPSIEIVIVGKKDAKDTQQIIKEINTMYLPNKVVIVKEPDEKDQSLDILAPLLKVYSQITNKVTIYICKNHHCKLPTTDIKKMKQQLIYC